MHIVVPMSGKGQRFLDAGYSVPKPLIEIDGIPIIEHVVNLFPGESKFTFICSEDHLKETEMRKILERIAPKGEIVSISPHKKGPIYAVSQIFSKIDNDEEVIVNYCDFSSWWDYSLFLDEVHEANADGAVVSYRGFHPHMLGSTNYAFIRNEGPWLLEIKEKQPFTNNRMEEFASNGTYYFRKGKFVKQYFQEVMDKGLDVKGEFYVSVVYNLLVRDNLKVYIPTVEHMLQWGTPQDVAEYNEWSKYFRGVGQQSPPMDLHNTLCLMPMAGRGSRFQKEGYEFPKPMIPVDGDPMFIRALSDLPKMDNYLFVVLKELLENSEFIEAFEKNLSKAKSISLDEVTQGQAETCEIALASIEDLNQSVLIAACDNGVVVNQERARTLFEDPTVDAIAWSFRNHPSSTRNPEMYGWMAVDGDNAVKAVSVKKAISDHPENDHAIVGTFFFRHIQDYMEAVKELKKNNHRINGEFYVDSLLQIMIDQGKNVKVLEVDHYICWGTPNDYRTYQYWQQFFHKCWWHPYKNNQVPEELSV